MLVANNITYCHHPTLVWRWGRTQSATLPFKLCARDCNDRVRKIYIAICFFLTWFVETNSFWNSNTVVQKALCSSIYSERPKIRASSQSTPKTICSATSVTTKTQQMIVNNRTTMPTVTHTTILMTEQRPITSTLLPTIKFALNRVDEGVFQYKFCVGRLPCNHLRRPTSPAQTSAMRLTCSSARLTSIRTLTLSADFSTLTGSTHISPTSANQQTAPRQHRDQQLRRKVKSASGHFYSRAHSDGNNRGSNIEHVLHQRSQDKKKHKKIATTPAGCSFESRRARRHVHLDGGHDKLSSPSSSCLLAFIKAPFRSWFDVPSNSTEIRSADVESVCAMFRR